MIVVCPICGKENALKLLHDRKWNAICVGYPFGDFCHLYQSVDKKFYWCTFQFGQKKVAPEEFERWLKLKAFQ